MTTKPEKNKFRYPKLIIAEGEDDAHFIFSFLNHIDESLSKKIHIHWVCGNGKLLYGHKVGALDVQMFGLEKMITDQEFMDNVKDIAVIFDAEKNAKNSFENIINQCSQANKVAQKNIDGGARAAVINLPVKVCEFSSVKGGALKPNLSVFLFDTGDGTGALEDLYLSTLEDQEAMLLQDCIEKMIKCAEGKAEKIDHKKVKTQSFLAIKDPTLKSIGFAATEKKINFKRGLERENSPLNLLKNFLIDFSKL